MSKDSTEKNSIKLNDILHLTDEELKRTKCRFMVPSGDFQPLLDAQDREKINTINLVDLVYNRNHSIPFRARTIAIGFLPLGDNMWILTGVVDVLKDNGRGKAASAKYKNSKFNFRLIIKFHKNFQNGIVKAENFIDQFEVLEIWSPEKTLCDKKFPGYKNVCVAYHELRNKLRESSDWRDYLKRRKGIYLISDKKSGKLYVGSAYGEDGIYGRWKTYMKSGFDKNEVENGKYPNKEFEKIVKTKSIKYIQNNFQYSILETFPFDTSDEDIIRRESWWKNIVLSRKFGYNAN